jgi:hypothetical protein
MDILFWIFVTILLIIGYKCYFGSTVVTENFYEQVGDEFQKYKNMVLAQSNPPNVQQSPIDPAAIDTTSNNLHATEAAVGVEYAPIVDVPIYTGDDGDNGLGSRERLDHQRNQNRIIKKVDFESVPTYALSNQNGKQQQLSQRDLLPLDQENSTWAKLNPRPNGWLEGQSFLNAGYHLGLNTVGQTKKNANYQLRSEPANPQTVVGPWNQSQIDPDRRRCFDIN